MTRTPARILVIRNDKLGDFMLAWPAFALLRRAFPEARIDALVPDYTREMAEACESLDGVVRDPGPATETSSQFDLVRRIRSAQYEAAVSFYSTARVGLALLLARVPYRLAPATKLAQAFHNRRVAQRRSRSLKPEYEYNVDLARAVLRDHGVSDPGTPERPYLRFPERDTAALREEFCGEHDLDPSLPLVFLHPGSGGSATNLTPEQFNGLARRLHDHLGHATIITAGPGEERVAEIVAAGLDGLAHVVFRSGRGILEFARHVAFADAFVSGSTGPLHVAGALDRPTAGFYRRRRSSTALRWQTLSAPERRLEFSPPDGAGESDFDRIDLRQAAEAISRIIGRRS